MVLCFLDFSCFLKSCVAVSACEDAVTSFSLYWQPSGMKCLRSALRGILRLSQNVSMDMPPPHFLSPVRGEFLRLYASPDSIKSGWVLSLLFAFPRVVEGCSSVYAFSQSCWVSQLSAHAECPQRLHTLPSGAHIRWVSVWVWNAACWRPKVIVMGQYGGIHRWCPQWLTGRLPDGVCKVVSGTVSPVVFWALAAMLSTSPCPSGMQITSVFWKGWERSGCPQ